MDDDARLRRATGPPVPDGLAQCEAGAGARLSEGDARSRQGMGAGGPDRRPDVRRGQAGHDPKGGRGAGRQRAVRLVLRLCGGSGGDSGPDLARDAGPSAEPRARVGRGRRGAKDRHADGGARSSGRLAGCAGAERALGAAEADDRGLARRPVGAAGQDGGGHDAPGRGDGAAVAGGRRGADDAGGVGRLGHRGGLARGRAALRRPVRLAGGQGGAAQPGRARPVPARHAGGRHR